MTDYQYRVIYRKRAKYWQVASDADWKVYHTAGNPAGRPYTNAQAVKGIVTTENNWNVKSDGMYEFKAQRFPLTQEWEDL